MVGDRAFLAETAASTRIFRMLVLASASPRRQELLRNARFVFKVQPAHIPEEPLPGFPGLVRFEARVETVLADKARADSEPGVMVVDGVRFSIGCPAAAVLRDWRRVVHGLLGGA